MGVDYLVDAGSHLARASGRDAGSLHLSHENAGTASIHNGLGHRAKYRRHCCMDKIWRASPSYSRILGKLLATLYLKRDPYLTKLPSSLMNPIALAKFTGMFMVSLARIRMNSSFSPRWTTKLVALLRPLCGSSSHFSCPAIPYPRTPRAEPACCSFLSYKEE